MATFKVGGRNFGYMLLSITKKLVRTYKGEIRRTQTGLVSSFPLSFVTVGFDVSLLGDREDMRLLEQAVLSSDTFQLETDYDGVTIKGRFSCTSNSYEEVRDKNEEKIRLSLSIVSDGSPITNAQGEKFKVSFEGTTLAEAYFGQVVPVDDGYAKDGVKLSGQILVLGDEELTETGFRNSQVDDALYLNGAYEAQAEGYILEVV